MRRGSGRPRGQRAACTSTGDGREHGRRPCLRHAVPQPASRSAPRAGLSHGRRPCSRPALAHRGPWARASSPGSKQPGFAGLLFAAGSAAHAHGPLCASACKVIWPPAARVAFPPSRATRPLRCSFSRALRLRGLCAPSAAEAPSPSARPPRRCWQTARGGPQAAPQRSYAVVW